MNKVEFLEVVDQCIEEKGIKFLVVAVEGVGEEEELIINPRVNFEGKREYYDKVYDDYMVHKHSPTIKITYAAGWTHLSYYEEDLK
jgi:hypothetical protein